MIYLFECTTSLWRVSSFGVEKYQTEQIFGPATDELTIGMKTNEMLLNNLVDDVTKMISITRNEFNIQFSNDFSWILMK